MKTPTKKNMNWTTRLAVLGLAVSATFSSNVIAQGLPDCDESSTPYMTFAFRGGQYFAPYNGQPDPNYYATFGLRNLSTPGEMVMESGGTIFHSPDEGCSWNTVYELQGNETWPLWIEPGADGHAFGFSLNYTTLFALQNTGNGMNASSLKVPVSNIMGLGTDPSNANHVRIAGKDGQIWDSTNGGVNWNTVGVAPNKGKSATRVSFDPNDLDHVVYMTITDGAFVTFDGGRNWTSSNGLTKTNGPRNAFNAVVSPIDSRLVWCMSIDLDEADSGHRSGGKHIYASIDGGRTFFPRADNNENGIVITNGPELTAHPTDLRKVAWVASNRFTGLDVYELNGKNRQVKQHHNDNLGGRCVEYYLPNPKHMLIGLETKN